MVAMVEMSNQTGAERGLEGSVQLIKQPERMDSQCASWLVLAKDRNQVDGYRNGS
jgi:hypothetical protein